MKNHSLYLVLPAISVFIVFLFACGEGEAIDLSEQGAGKDLANSIYDLTNSMKDCEGSNTNSELRCPSVSSTPSSSSTDEEYPYSSDDPDNPFDGDSSSSFDGPVGISSEEPPPEPPENPYPVPAFTCSWNPASIITGDSVTLNLNITGSTTGTEAADCTGKASVDLITGSFKDTAYFVVGKKVMAAGAYTDRKNNSPFISAADASWPTSGQLRVKGILTCASASYASWFGTADCAALSITAATKPDSSGIGLTCPWKTLPEGTGNLAIGENISASCTPSGSISNSSVAGCGPITAEVTGNTNNSGTVTAKAVATCRGTKYALKTLTYNVRGACNIGACTWSAERYTKGETATPSVSVSNNYGRCTSTFSGGFPRVLVQSDVGNLTSTATVSCGSYSCTGSPTVTCPSVSVVGAAYTITKKLTNISIPAGEEKFIVSVTISATEWQYNDAYLKGQANQGSGNCTVIAKPITTGCGSMQTATLSGTSYLGRVSMGRPSCSNWEMEVASSGCNTGYVMDVE